MSNLRQAAEAALEDICGAKLCEANSMSSRTEMLRLMDKAITALRAALAEPVQEPVPSAWRYKDTARICDNSDKRITAPPGWVPLYSAPPSQVIAPRTDAPQRKPLTDDEIHDCWQQRHRDKTTERRLITRAIERAHGIKENT